jgi:hypothetical protein
MQAFFVGEVELIVAHPGPRHAPLAINSDHRHPPKTIRSLCQPSRERRTPQEPRSST